MLESAVQHTREGLGSRKDLRKQTTPSSQLGVSSAGSKVVKQQQPTESELVHFPTSTFAYPKPLPSSTASSMVTSNHSRFLSLAPTNGEFPPANDPRSEQATAPKILQLNIEPDTMPKAVPSYIVNNFSHLKLGQTNDELPFGAFQFVQPLQQISQSQDIGSETRLKHLSKMLEGYRNFVSLRKAVSILEFPSIKLNGDDLIQSNFGTSKKMCKVEASLILDVSNRFFQPFNELGADDKNKLFDHFYCLFSNTERAFRMSKMFSEDDDRLLMPDGGYVRLSQMEKFYSNNSLVRGDPLQMAKIFEDAMRYMLKIVVPHMRQLNVAEVELMALCGMFLWTDMAEDISHSGSQIVAQVRAEIIVDLHAFYVGQGYAGAAITLRITNLFLILPKLENLVRLLKENFSIAELFNMLDLDGMCCSKKCA